MKHAIYNNIEAKSHLIEKINKDIWDYAELGLQEYKSIDLYSRLLEEEGFKVTKNLAGMPTAFEASFGSGKPIIGIMAEYDALPNLSQKAGTPSHIPIVEGNNGHGCGHNSLGAASFGAVLAVKEYMVNNNLKGTIKLFGCPSEEKDNGKTFMARDGYFDDLDAAFTWHPSDKNAAWGLSSLANISVVFHFKGKTAHAAATPHLGRSALDSAEIMSIGVNYLREHIIPEARVHYAYLDTGGTAPNVVQGTTSVHYYIRAPKVKQVLEIYDRIKDIAKGAALMCGTESRYELYTGLSDYIPNKILTEVLHESMVEFGSPEFDETDFKLAREFFMTLSKTEQDDVNKYLIANFGKEKAKNILEKPLHTAIETLKILPVAMPGSTDVGDLSYVTPTAQLTIATCALGTSPHTWQMTAQGNTSMALKGVKAAAGAMALASLKIMKDPELAKKAREELNIETGGEYICPIPKDLKPKI